MNQLENSREHIDRVSKDGLVQNIYMFFFFSLIPILLYRPVFQNDTYWLINTGKFIINNGIPKTEPFTIHEGLNLVVQQWLSTILFFAGFRTYGVAGIHLLTILTYAIILFGIYRLTLMISERKKLLSCYVTAVAGICLWIYMVPRPQIFSLLIFLLEIAFIECYLRHTRRGILLVVGLALLSLVLINIQAAIWPMFFLFALPYLADSFKFKFGFLMGQGYPKAPLLVGLLVAFVCGFANPYGFQALTYLYKSYGNTVINRLVREMSSPDFKSSLGNLIFFHMLFVVCIYLFLKGRTRLRYVLISIGTLYMGLASVRSYLYFLTFGLIFLSYFLKDINISHTMPTGRRGLILAVGVVLALSLRIHYFQKYGMPVDEESQPEASVAFILKNLNHAPIRIFNEYDAGGYMEFMGIRTFIDSRAEIFTKKINGKEDILKDYYEALTGQLYYAEFIDKYSFTHLLVTKGKLLDNCLKNDRRFGVLLRDKKYILYEKVSAKS